jgi:hypothetical protein
MSNESRPGVFGEIPVATREGFCFGYEPFGKDGGGFAAPRVFQESEGYPARDNRLRPGDAPITCQPLFRGFGSENSGHNIDESLEVRTGSY